MRRPHVLVGLTLLAMLAFSFASVADRGTSSAEMSPNMLHDANRPPTPPTGPAVTNSDIAFWQGGGVRGPHRDLAAVGSHNGFRLFDIRDPENPVEIVNVRCRANQGDVSFYQAGDRLLLIQSIDRPVTTDDCALARDTPVVSSPRFPTRFAPGFEGLRIFDVTQPETPVHIASAATACGSHTHTTIPDKDNQRAIIYVSSYPVGASVTPPQLQAPGPRCEVPHAKISIVEIYDRDPTTPIVREHPLDADTRPFRGTLGSGGIGAVGCHDVTAFFDVNRGPETSPRRTANVAAAACREEGQLWDISDPANPRTTGPVHSHIRNPFITPANPVAGGLFHTASFTWDGKVIAFTDERQGGGAHGCDGPQDTRGNVWFYKNVTPGTPVVPLYGRYMIPRPQPAAELCTLHNGNVIPTNEGYFGVSSSYQGGTTVFDFSDVLSFPELNIERPGFDPADPATIPPLVGREIAYADMQGVDGRTRDDAWASYWYNDHIWVNGGLDRGGGWTAEPTRRGFDVFHLLGQDGRLVDRNGQPAVTPGENERSPGVQQFGSRKFRYMNPQTQEVSQGQGSTAP